MDKKTIDLIINMLRQGTIQWEGRKIALLKARKQVVEGITSAGKEIRKYYWQCFRCKEWFRDIKSVEVDHIVEIGSFKGDWNDYIGRMYCSQDNLQVLCLRCHQSKTTANASLRWTRK